MAWARVSAGTAVSTPRRVPSRVARTRGGGGQGALTSESQAGDRVAAPVFLRTREVAGPHQQAAQHGSGRRRGSAEARARDGSGSAEPDTHGGGAVVADAPPGRSPNAWERPQGGHQTLAGRTLPKAGGEGQGSDVRVWECR